MYSTLLSSELVAIASITHCSTMLVHIQLNAVKIPPIFTRPSLLENSRAALPEYSAAFVNCVDCIVYE